MGPRNARTNMGPRNARKLSPQQEAMMRDPARQQIPECNGTRAGARARSHWFRTAKSLEARGLGHVERDGGDRYVFISYGEGV